MIFANPAGISIDWLVQVLRSRRNINPSKAERAIAKSDVPNTKQRQQHEILLFAPVMKLKMMFSGKRTTFAALWRNDGWGGADQNKVHGSNLFVNNNGFSIQNRH